MTRLTLAVLTIVCAAPSEGARAQAPPLFGTPRSDLGLEGAHHVLELADLDGDARLDVVVLERYPGSVRTGLGDGHGRFATKAISTAALAPFDLGAGDFDGDGTPDVVVSDHLYQYGVVLLPGDGQGGFLSPSLHPNPLGVPRSLDVGDVDADANLDVVVAQAGAGSLSVYRGDGAGAFAVTHQDQGTGYDEVLLGDVDGDGALDALALSTTNASKVYVDLGDGAGGFTAATPHDAGGLTYKLGLGDLDLDGILDLAVQRNPYVLQVSRGVGDGTFAPLATIQDVSKAEVRVGDLTGDGTPDLVCGRLLFAGLGGGVFADASLLASNSATAVGDVDGDGGADLVSAPGENSGVKPWDVSVALSRPFGAPGHAMYPETGYYDPAHAGVFDLGDADGDGDIDVLASPYGPVTPPLIVARLNDGAGGFDAEKISSLPAGASGYVAWVVTGHVDTDPHLDVVVPTNTNSGTVRIGFGDGTGGFGGWLEPTLGPPYGSIGSVVSRDLDLDGKTDLVFVHVDQSLESVRVLRGDGAGGFTQMAGFPIDQGQTKGPECLAVGDLDGDGLDDLAVAEDPGYPQVVVTVAMASAPFTFGPPARYAASAHPVRSVRLADLDADGDLDVLAAAGSTSGGPGRVHVLRNDGSGSLLAPQTVVSGPTSVLSLAVADVDGDGTPDAVAGHSSCIAVLPGDGLGGLAAPRRFASAWDGSVVRAADLDSDGTVDVVTSGITVHRQGANCPQGAIVEYGAGCPGGGGAFQPRLAGDGCPTPGGPITLDLTHGAGGALSLLLLGFGAAEVPVGFGCDLLVAPLLPTPIPVPLGGSGPGAGSFHLDLAVPAGTPPGSAYLQAFVPDGLAPGGISATQGLRIDVE